MPILLSIAGSDSGGGAGIQADLKTFEAHGCFGTTAIVALTAQHTLGVNRVELVSPEMIAAQLEALFGDLAPQAIKVGMLGSAVIAAQVASLLRRLAVPLGIPIVVDPVMVATSGDVLLAPEAIHTLLAQVLPLAQVITPNRHEAALLAQLPVDTVADAAAAAERIAVSAPAAHILIKGIRTAEGSTDVLWRDGEVRTFSLPWLEVQSTHGTGCTLSSAIAARLALGHSVPEAVRLAKAYVHAAIANAPSGIGKGHTPLRHRIALPE
jgi:hydroxymethylpyrimidine/phosphomethylpyrimidine kinase